jgi:V/A-type H+-transporting ATPase subunit C
MSSAFDYGNARLRARKGRLFDQRDYQELLAKDLEGLITSLAQTDYKQDVEAALVRFRGLRCVQEALRTNLARTLRQAAGFYEGQARQQVDLLMTRWDRRNLLALMRAHAAPASVRQAADVTFLLVPAGRLDETDLAQLAAQPGLRAMLDLLVVWGIPDATTARSLLQAWPGYESSGNLTVLEGALSRAYGHWLQQWIACADLAHPPRMVADNGWLRWFLCKEQDLTNLMVALRLREARLWGRPISHEGDRHGTPGTGYIVDQSLPGGALSLSLLQEIVDMDRREDVMHRTSRAPGMSPWQPALETWSEDGDLPALETALEETLTREAVALFTRGDPLSIAVPVAYVAAKENEVRNLRLLGQGLAYQLDVASIRDRMLVLW